MIWPLLLICISGYSWYLMIMTSIVSINARELLIGFIINSLLPAFGAYTLNSKLIVRKPTFATILRKNLQQYILYCGLFCLINFIRRNLDLPLPLAWFLPIIWQGMSWFCGFNAVFQLTFPLKKAGYISIKAVESSLIIFLPAFIILHLMKAPFLTLFLLLAGWFLALFITLDVGGHGTQKKICRYDLITLHLLVPTIITALLFLASFSQEAYLYLRLAYKKIISILAATANYLNVLLSRGLEEKNYLESSSSSAPSVRKMIPYLQEMPPWFNHFLVLLAVICLLAALSILIKIIKNRIKSAAVFGAQIEKKAVGGQLSLSLRTLLEQIKKWVISCIIKIKLTVKKIKLKAVGIIYLLRQPHTPKDKVIRNFYLFLRLGQKKGLPRKNCETPLEYITRLRQYHQNNNIPFPFEEASRLTFLFLQAVYSNISLEIKQSEESSRLVMSIKNKWRSQKAAEHT